VTFRQRCYLVYAVAPESLSAREANDLLNEYIEDRGRGIVVFHDHFAGSPHGGIAVFDVRSDAERAMLEDPGPLVDWRLQTSALTFALSAVGFIEQTEFTLAQYGKTTVEREREAEPADPRFWWRRAD